MKNIKLIVPKIKDYYYEQKLEGESDSLDEWRKIHIDYFSKINSNFTEDTKVMFEIFEVVGRFK